MRVRAIQALPFLTHACKVTAAILKKHFSFRLAHVNQNSCCIYIAYLLFTFSILMVAVYAAEASWLSKLCKVCLWNCDPLGRHVAPHARATLTSR